ncbi:methylmalonyl Co-A mutase-associated GTPase MeaB [Lacibacterium aquatile]|uniref:Methylmalonyl Co-A mutase-associated GTPase MeaB n=1 Tax=Lacibacterium aquatile TaxID=1168082 RepID=A0ABW5DLF0_9PROT
MPDLPLLDEVLAGRRRALARLITLIESSRPDHRTQAEAMLDQLSPHTGGAIRVGISGVPGVGKSSFIESIGLYLIEQGHKVAVLAVDPSSRRTGGSILGDKTRMEHLARNEGAFIRPSPSGGTLGGVARRTAESILAVEAAGYDVVIIETVGVGQSETAVADMSDVFLLLLQPGAGDDLQGIKKGIVELADLIVVNKADGDLANAATRAVADYRAALHLLRPASKHWSPPVLAASAATGMGLPEVWQKIGAYAETMKREGLWQTRREEQAVGRLWAEVTDALVSDLKAAPKVGAELPGLLGDVRSGRLSPTGAARRLIAAFRG